MTIDLKKTHAAFYRAPRGDVVEVVVPACTYLAVDGRGDPNTTPAYREAVEALYVSAYTIRAVVTKRGGEAFVVGPLEGLWWSEDPSSFTRNERAAWEWTMLIPLPEHVSADDIATGLASAAKKKPDASLDRVRALTLAEGRCLQIMHVGPYAEEGPTLARLHHEVMPARGLTWNGPHHEIYLGDPRRAAPEKLRTVLRQPVRPIA